MFSVLVGWVSLVPPPDKQILRRPRACSPGLRVITFIQIVAGTFNVVKAGRFYGRYWGAFEKVKNLHFEACCESGGSTFFPWWR